MPLGPVRWEWGADLLAGNPVGPFAQHAERGGGFGIFGIRYFGAGRSLGLRADLMLVSHGRTSVSYPLTLGGMAIDVDVSTENVMSTSSVGPHFVLGRGRERPYSGAHVGVSEFVTTTTAWSGGQA